MINKLHNYLKRVSRFIFQNGTPESPQEAEPMPTGPVEGEPLPTSPDQQPTEAADKASGFIEAQYKNTEKLSKDGSPERIENERKINEIAQQITEYDNQIKQVLNRFDAMHDRVQRDNRDSYYNELKTLCPGLINSLMRTSLKEIVSASLSGGGSEEPSKGQTVEISQTMMPADWYKQIYSGAIINDLEVGGLGLNEFRTPVENARNIINNGWDEQAILSRYQVIARELTQATSNTLTQAERITNKYS